MPLLKKILYYLLLFISTALIGITLVSLAYDSSLWYLKVLSFPRLLVLIALAGCLILVILTLRRNWKLSLATLIGLLIAIAIQSYILYPYTPFTSPRVAEIDDDAVLIDKKAVFSVLVANVLMTNRESNKLLKIIRDKDPTFVLAMEVNTWWVKQLDTLRDRYPHRISFPADNTYGMVLYAKIPLKNARIHFFSNDSVPSFMTTVTLPTGDTFDMLAVHPVPPMPSEHPDNVGEKEVALMKAGRLMQNRSPALVFGDFNDVGWSYNSRRFSELSKLNDVRAGRGMYSTFSAKSSIFRWPLDYVFVSKEFRVIDIERLDGFGSDHFPFYAKLALLPRLPVEEDD